MKPRAFNLHPNETPAAAIGRLHRYIRQLHPGIQPVPKAVSRSNLRRMEHHTKPFLRLVKG